MSHVGEAYNSRTNYQALVLDYMYMYVLREETWTYLVNSCIIITIVTCV